MSSLKKDTIFLLFVGSILPFSITYCYQQDFNPQDLYSYFQFDEAKMEIFLPSKSWTHSVENGVVFMTDTANPDVFAFATVLAPHPNTSFPSADTSLDEVAKTHEDILRQSPGFVKILQSEYDPLQNAYLISSLYVREDQQQQFTTTIFIISQGLLYSLTVDMPSSIAEENIDVVTFLTSYFIVGEDYDMMQSSIP